MSAQGRKHISQGVLKCFIISLKIFMVRKVTLLLLTCMRSVSLARCYLHGTNWRMVWKTPALKDTFLWREWSFLSGSTVTHWHSVSMAVVVHEVESVRSRLHTSLLPCGTLGSFKDEAPKIHIACKDFWGRFIESVPAYIFPPFLSGDLLVHQSIMIMMIIIIIN